MAPGGTVEIVVSDGPSPVPVPSVVALEAGDANDLLIGLGFSVSINFVDVEYGSVNDRRVMSQSPASGLEVPPGSFVVISVGRQGEPPEETTPPEEPAP